MRRRLTQFVLVALALYWVLIFTGTHWPKLELPSAFSATDKVAHLVAFFGLAVLLAAALRAFRPLHLSHYAAILFLLALYGAIDELSQRLVPGRSASWFDWLADLTGGLAGLLAFALFDFWWSKRRSSVKETHA